MMSPRQPRCCGRCGTVRWAYIRITAGGLRRNGASSTSTPTTLWSSPARGSSSGGDDGGRLLWSAYPSRRGAPRGGRCPHVSLTRVDASLNPALAEARFCPRCGQPAEVGVYSNGEERVVLIVFRARCRPAADDAGGGGGPCVLPRRHPVGRTRLLVHGASAARRLPRAELTSAHRQLSGLSRVRSTRASLV